MSIEKVLLNGGSLVASTGKAVWKGAGFVCSQGHTVATQLRRVADGLDYMAYAGEKACIKGEMTCELIKANYMAKLKELEEREAEFKAKQSANNNNASTSQDKQTTINSNNNNNPFNDPTFRSNQSNESTVAEVQVVETNPLTQKLKVVESVAI